MKTFRVVRKWTGANSEWSVETVQHDRLTEVRDFGSAAEAIREADRLQALDQPSFDPSKA